MGQDYLSCGLLADGEMAAFQAPQTTWCTAIPPGHPTFSKTLEKDIYHALNTILQPGLSAPFANVWYKKLRGRANSRTCFLSL